MTWKDAWRADDATGFGNAGRSTLLRAGLVDRPRHRPTLRRRLWLAAAGGLIVLFLLAVAARWFSRSGTGILVYWIHDHVWLPLRGQLWTAIFPAGFIWAVPICLVLALVLTEYLVLFAPLRAAQIGLLRWLSRPGRGWVLVGGAQLIAPLGLVPVQAIAVLSDLRQTEHARLLEALDRGGAVDPGRLAQLEALLVQLLPAGEVQVLAALEAIALTTVANRRSQGGLEALHARLAAMAPPLDALVRRSLDLPSPLESLRLASDLEHDVTPSPSLLAARTLAVALAIRADGRSEHLAWFQAWARRRLGPQPERLAEAEGLVAFEFWAALAERSVPERTAEGLLGDVFGRGLLNPALDGEGFARLGQGVGP